jgi:hypothetical protein
MAKYDLGVFEKEEGLRYLSFPLIQEEEKPEQETRITTVSGLLGTKEYTYSDTRWRPGTPKEAFRRFWIMPESEYIKGIYKDIGQLRTEQERRFDSIEEGVKGNKNELKELRAEFKEDLKSGIEDAKTVLGAQITAIDTKLDNQSWLPKAVLVGIISVFFVCLFGFLGLWYKEGRRTDVSPVPIKQQTSQEALATNR